MGYVPDCEYCGNEGLLWVAFDHNGQQVDVMKEIEGIRPPIPQQAPCVCNKGYRMAPDCPERIRSKNAQYGFRIMYPDGRKGIDVINEKIKENYGLTRTDTDGADNKKLVTDN
jgi:hypothetical protein